MPAFQYTLSDLSIDFSTQLTIVQSTITALGGTMRDKPSLGGAKHVAFGDLPGDFACGVFYERFQAASNEEEAYDLDLQDVEDVFNKALTFVTLKALYIKQLATRASQILEIRPGASNGFDLPFKFGAGDGLILKDAGAELLLSSFLTGYTFDVSHRMLELHAPLCGDPAASEMDFIICVIGLGHQA
jgi:hypothetical protein